MIRSLGKKATLCYLAVSELIFISRSGHIVFSKTTSGQLRIKNCKVEVSQKPLGKILEAGLEPSRIRWKLERSELAEVTKTFNP